MDTYEPGDGVWFLIPQQSITNNDQTQSVSLVDSNLFYPGVVIEYHVKGNVLTIKLDPMVDQHDVNNVHPTNFGPHQNQNQHQQFTVENNPAYIRRRIVSNEDKSSSASSGVMDMITMNDLSEPALLWNIRQRYKNGNIYTYVGSMLISVNPYKMYDNIYGLPVVKKYEGRVLGDLPPHLFALASASYTRMCKDTEPQVIVISGESGSGKTECTKLILGYLALVNKSPSNLITEQILEASPLLESFGNAKTLRNDNSSRFGKYLQVFFDESSSTSIITGCRITEYLLEKSRIVTQNQGERNYHVFYELLQGLSKEQKEKYGLLTADKYFYLNQGSSLTTSIQGKNDAEDFQALISAMQILGFSSTEIDCVFKVLAAVLHLGNVYFHRKALKQGMEGVEIGSDAEIQWIGHLLEINPDGLRKVLTTRTTETPRGEKMTTPLTIDQSLDCRDAIAKILYSNLFTWLVQRVNRIVYSNQLTDKPHHANQKPTRTCINILDIFGFENFKENSFEQLCINYANESIHNFLTRYVFKLEQAEYAKEKIDWVPIDFEDNLHVINLLVKKPVGILHLLDDESNFPKGTDASFLEKCHYNHALNENYLRQRMSSKEFGIKHYAGGVWYNTEGFLDKNRGDFGNSQQDYGLRRLLCSSKEKTIARMFILGTQAEHAHNQPTKKAAPSRKQQHSPKSNGGNQHSPNRPQDTRLFITMKPRAPTVSARFTSSLNSLLESMSRCSPWFVRCIKPNNEKKPNLFDTDLVLDQLRYSGILETIKIRKLGYPIRYNFSNFVHRYKCLINNSNPYYQHSHQNKQQSYRDLTRLILTSDIVTSGNAEDFQVGASKVFLREMLEQRLEKGRYDLLNKSAKIIQSRVRGHLAEKRYRNARSAALKIQAYYRMHRARRDFLKVRAGVKRLQATVRMRRDMKRYRVIRDEIVKRNNKRRFAENSEKAANKAGHPNNYGLTGVNHLEIPAELAFILSRIDTTDSSGGKVEKSSSTTIRKIQQSTELTWNFGNLEKFAKSSSKIAFQNKNEQLRMRREPIVSPFLKHSPKDESLIIFKLILRYMNDVNISGMRELLLQNYIVNKGIRNEYIRDEILVQILNQTQSNPNRMNCERGWVLLAASLSAFQPRDESLFQYLIQFLSDYDNSGVDEGFERNYKAICQLKLLQMVDERKRGRCRQLPPFGPMELKTIDRKVQGQVFIDIEGVYERIESWFDIGEIAAKIGAKKYGGRNYEGFWTLDYLEDDDSRWELDSSSFVFDTNFENVDFTQFGKVFGIGGEFAGSPSLLFAKMMYCQPAGKSLEPSLKKLQQSSPPILTPPGGSNGGSSGMMVMSRSKLNQRYFKEENSSKNNSRTKSLDNLLDDGESSEQSSAAVLQRRKLMGLSDSKLNQRYNNSIENLNQLPRRKTSDNYFDDFVDEEDELAQFNSDNDEEFEAELLKPAPKSSSSNNRSGPPRYIKALSGSKKPPSSVGSKGYYAKSSAMSDTSEAPSLASHVRRVRVPSQASDVDQFLDDLFSPVLEGSNMLDDLSDVRSLVSNLKGGGAGVYDENQTNFAGFGGGAAGTKKSANHPAAFIQSAMEQNIQIQQQLIEQNQALQELLRRSSVEKIVDAPMPNKSNKNSNGSSHNLSHSHNSHNHNHSHNSHNSNANIPVPPPLPPVLLGEINGNSRPFMDPYGRAKTVRIGKWRWPPKENEGNDEFNEFRARLEERRRLDEDDHDEWAEVGGPGPDDSITSNSNNKSKPIGRNGHPKEIEPVVTIQNHKQPMGNKKNPPPVRNPFGDVIVGKLKLSQEMRAKLEQVTSLRVPGGNKKNPPGLHANPFDNMDTPKKLDDSRRAVLQEKLMGRDNGGPNHNNNFVNSSSKLPPPPPPPLPGMHPSSMKNNGLAHSHPNQNHQMTHAQLHSQQQQLSLKMDENYDTLSQVYNQVTSPKGNKYSDNFFNSGNNKMIMEPIGNNGGDRVIEPPDYDYSDYESGEERVTKKLKLHSNRFQNSYGFMLKRFKLRKDLLSEDELKDQELVGFLKEQILRDLKHKSPRISDQERRQYLEIGGGTNNLIEIARSWGFYFWRFFRVHQQIQTTHNEDYVSYIAVNEKGVKLVGVRQNKLHILDFYSWSKIVTVLATTSAQSINKQSITITLGNGQKLSFGTTTAVNIQRTCETFFMNEIHSLKKGDNLISKTSGGNNQNSRRISSGSGGSSGGGSAGERGSATSGGRHIKMKSAAVVSRSALLSHQHHQINHGSGGSGHAGSYGDEVDSFDFNDEDAEFLGSGSGGNGNGSGPAGEKHFSRKVAASGYYDHEDDEHLLEFGSSQNYGSSGHIPKGSQNKSGLVTMETDVNQSMSELDSALDSPEGRPVFENDGKHSLLQFAMKYFRQKDKFTNSIESQEDNCWTWREQISLVKFSPKMLTVSLLPLLTEELNRLALECFASILKYMGDYPENPSSKKNKHPEANSPAGGLLVEVEAVYTLLRNCHIATSSASSPTPTNQSVLGLADEVYCQIMKQTTNNTIQRSAQRGWRLFTILAAYFTCSDTLKPYLFKYLETNAYDKRRAFHGTALVTLQNLRKTFKYGGRRNVPSVEEITAITAGRNAKRQIFRLPGGAQRVVNVKAATVVQDVLDELCSSCLNIPADGMGSSSEERNEFSIYCIVEGDTTMPLQREEYILDVTTELQKNQQVYYLIFCRSVWFFPMRLESNNNEVYIDLVFNQIAPDYLEGLLLTLPGQTLEQSVVYDIARIAALLHRAADLTTPPTLKETKYLLPKPALAARDMRPNQWVSLVNKYWAEERMGDDLLRPIQAKAIVLEILQKWDLFGSSFFSVKRMADPSPPEEYILALNKNGVHFLDIITHETINWWSYSEIISTRKVKNEDGLLYLDLKVGNLMQQRITRLQTEHAHEISRLIRQYIHIQKYSAVANK